MAEGSQETNDRRVPGASRASTAPALPMIITSNATGPQDAHPSGNSHHDNDHDSKINDNHNNNSPRITKPGLLRTSQTFPIGSIASDNASSSSVNQQDTKRNPRSSFQASSYGRNSTSSPTVFEPSADSSAIDPLSQHIIKRTNTERSIPLRLLGRASYEVEAGGAHDYYASEQGSIRGDTSLRQKLPKEKRKGVSFLSRFIGGKKKDQLSDAEDDVSEPDTFRMDANTAPQPIGFLPRFPPPPKYIRVKAYYKKDKTFDRVFLAQELDDAGPSSDRSVKDAAGSTTGLPGSSNAGKAIWALSFSKDGKYMAAAGQDKKVRVWAVIASPEDRQREGLGGIENGHNEDETPQLRAPVFKAKPVQVYEGHIGSVLDLSWSKHSDFVTSIQFHPRDDRFFLAGSLDTKLRLWSIPDKNVAFVATVPDMITSVAFTPDGRHSIAGCLNGMCNIYETDGFRPVGQIHVRSARGRNAKGSKITGIDTITLPPSDPNGEVKLLITSNDSRIRLYNFRDRTLEAKFRGNENTCSQIRASFSDDGKYIICGSEDRKTYVWSLSSMEKDSDKRAVEVFETGSSMVTAAVMAPSLSKQTLGFSDDPVYDICNPPPVTLVSTAEKQNGQRGPNPVASKLALESPSYLARSTHPVGNIIIVADYSGKIRVLRQDCAFHKRRYENWDTHSTISRKLLRRSNSARHSIASSIGKESSHKTPSERIISWRNSVIGHGAGKREGSRHGTTTRSSSPSKSIPDISRYSSPVCQFSGGAPADSLSLTVSPPPSASKSSFDSRRSSGDASKRNGYAEDVGMVPSSRMLIARGKEKDNPLWLQGEQSYAFWNKITQDALAARRKKSPRPQDSNRLSVPGRNVSISSALSSDYGSSNGDRDEGDVLRCDSCRGTNFQAMKSRTGKQKLICVRCHRPIN
ncbi:WD40 repeat domain-containing protein [Aspergillus clavatus NRRL 1]|uniref:WD repeat protein n=1 Tax=Aspergillus clavatus (strain ATCC 1007 / CBS 513.65 / DSM 816 / NCTC 3887 / NRRL 1 / QM 1276 / 107) TaxID=344612 RepID=A1CBH8_ASPCL|nr:WD repeat protein [Aspergillus clavatus NRRL 1]EAW13096.1 WD repeat protein [Aspergillus clavatus NRRL 1]